MTSYLRLDLSTITIDPRLARRIPYALSRYYLALPLGQENGRVSVAMAYPDNLKARRILSRLLHAEVVPVFTPPESLQAEIDRLRLPEPPQAHNILAWYGQPEWEAPVTTTATALGNALHADVTILARPGLSLDEALKMATNEGCQLVVCPLPANPALAAVLSQATIPLFFVGGDAAVGQQPPIIRAILVVLRGFASDEWALDWLAPLAGQHQAAVTLMPLTNGPDLDLAQYHSQESPAGQHLTRCRQRLRTAEVSVNLKFRQGNAVQQVVEEVTGDAYDLLVLAAEAEGDFANQVITAITQRHAHHDRPIFILKPSNPLPHE